MEQEKEIRKAKALKFKEDVAKGIFLAFIIHYFIKYLTYFNFNYSIFLII